MAKLEPLFPKSHGKPRVDDRRVLSGIIFINRNGLRWRDALAEYGPAKTLYSRWKRWNEKSIFAWMLLELANQGRETETLMIDATCDPLRQVPQGLPLSLRFGRRRHVLVMNPDPKPSSDI